MRDKARERQKDVGRRKLHVIIRLIPDFSKQF